MGIKTLSKHWNLKAELKKVLKGLFLYVRPLVTKVVGTATSLSVIKSCQSEKQEKQKVCVVCEVSVCRLCKNGN